MRKMLAILVLLVAYGLLYPGVSMPLMSITGYLDKAELVELGKELIQNHPDVPKMVVSLVDMVAGQIDVTGSVEAYERTQSILGAVSDLYHSGFVLVAFLIMFFSIVVPVIKGLAMLIGTLLRPGGNIQRFALAISKWSMADVFVVGVFIAFLAANAIRSDEHGQTVAETGGAPDALLSFSAELGPGFYFFLGYCLLSILSSQLFGRPEKS